MIKNKSIALKLIFSILVSCSVIFTLIFSYNYAVSRKIIVKNIESSARNLSLVTVNKIESILRPIEKVPQDLAYFLEGASYNKEELIDLLYAVIKNNPEIYGATIAFEPYAFNKDLLYFAPYYYRSSGKISFTYLKGNSYHYFFWDWYQIPKELGHPVWSEPYYDEGGGNIIMATYSVPFYKEVSGERKFMGIITADVSLSWLQEIVSSIKIEKTGFGFLVSKNGRIVTHPLKDHIMNETIFDLAEARGDPGLRVIGKEMLKGKFDFVPSKNIITGKKCWMVYAGLPSSGWSLGVIFPQDELMADISKLNRTVFFLGFGGFLFLLAVIVLISRSITRPLRRLYLATKDIAKGNLEFELPSIKSHDEVGKLAESFIYMKAALKKYIKELTETVASKERMESELRIAHEIQMGIVPKTFPAFPGRNEFDIYAVLEPAKEVGGDFYDFFFIDQAHLCFVIGDVVGKGVPAALFMAMTKTLLKSMAKENVNPDEVLNKVNKEISYENSSCMFITIFCAVLDTKSGELCYTNAGHNPPFLCRNKDKPQFLVGGKSSAIGIDENSVFKKECLILNPGDTILMYTDGVTEAFDADRRQFLESGLETELAHLQNAPAQELVKGILEKVKYFSRQTEQSDDLTLLALKYFSEDKKFQAPMDKSASFRLKNAISEIGRLKDFGLSFAKASNLAGEFIADVNLALEEIASNIILYGYADKFEHWISVNLSLNSDGLIVEIIDDAGPFNPLEYPPPDISKPLEDRGIGGLGIHIVRNVMQDLEYRREQDKNILIMKKKFK